MRLDESRARDSLLTILGLLSTVLYVALWSCERQIFWLDPARGGAWGTVFAIAWYVFAAGLLLVYRQAVELADRSGEAAPARLYLWVFFPLIQGLFLWLARPYLSYDVYGYLTHGVTAWLPGGNPYVEGSERAMASPFGVQLEALGLRIVNDGTPYGPLWTWLETGVAALSSSVIVGPLLLKAAAAAGFAAGCWAIWKWLAKAGSGHRLGGLVAFMWNPLLLLQTVHEGHNDGAMTGLTLLSLLWALEARPGLGLLAQAASVLVKWMTAILAPSQLLFSWRHRRAGVSAGRFAGTTGAAAVLSGLLCLALGWKFWAGSATFNGIREASELSSTTLVALLGRGLGPLLGPVWAARLAQAGVWSALGATVAWGCFRAKSAEGLVDAWASAALIYFFVVSGRVWPWYSVLPIGLLCAWPGTVSRGLVLALSAGALAGSPLALFRQKGVMSVAHAGYLFTAVAIYFPLAAAILWRARKFRRPSAGPEAQRLGGANCTTV